MSFIVSARKYRPQHFDDLIGQDHIATTLKNAIKTDKLAHAFLFSGPRGVGKTTSARILAKVLNCENLSKDFKACSECSACKALEENASFNIFELDAASNNSVEHIRSLNDQVRFQPQQGAFKIYIIDEVHMLSQAAFNAFLKTLEEPPPYAKFILATTEKHKIIPTILSRCQIFDFKRIQVSDIVDQLQQIADKEKREIDSEAMHLIAQKADGAMRDALSIYDRIVSSVDGKISYKEVAESLNVLDHDYYFTIVDASLKEDLPSLMVTLDDIIKKGFDVEQFVMGLMEHLRQLLFIKDTKTAALMDVGQSLSKRYENQATLTSSSFLLSSLSLLDKADMSLPRSQNKRLTLEIALSKIAYLSRLADKKKTSSPSLGAPKPKEVYDLPSESEVTVSEVSTTHPKTATEAKTITLSPKEPSSNPVDKEPNKAKENPKAEVTAKTKAAKPKAITTSKLSTPSISVDLDQLVADIKKEENELMAVDTPFTPEEVYKIFLGKKEETKSNSLKSAIDYCKIIIDGNMIYIKTPTEIFKDMIRQEMELVEKIRQLFPKKDLIIRFLVDLSAFPGYQAPQKVKHFTTKEKYELFKHKNPMFEQLVNEFKLKPR